MKCFDELIMNASVVKHDEFDDAKMFSIHELWWDIYDIIVDEYIGFEDVLSC